MVSDVLDLLGGGGAPPALRRPALELTFGDASAEDWTRAVVSVRLEAGLCPSVDMVEILLSSQDAPSVAVGDGGSVSLGYEDSETTAAFTGQVESVRRGIHGMMRVTAVNGGALLSKLRCNRSYEGQSAGQVVSDLAGDAGVTTGTIEDGVDLPFYALDDRRSGFQHIASLAVTCGFSAWLDPDGALQFLRPAGARPVQTFRYGQDVLEFATHTSTPIAGEVETIGEGAAGSEGKDAWGWLLKDAASVTGKGGTGDPKRERSDGALRSSDAAGSAASGHASLLALGSDAATLLVPGAPAVAAAATIEVANMPEDSLNGSFLVRRVCHRYAKRSGFTTRMTLARAGGAGGGGLGLPGGLL